MRGDFWPTVGVTGLILLLLYVGGFLFVGPLLGGLCLYFLKKIRGEPSSVETAFSGFRIAFMPLFLAGLAGTVATSVGLACLILPGVFLVGLTILTLVLVIDKRLDFWPAFKLSDVTISRHWGKFFGFMFVLALINVAGIMAVVVGLLVTAPITLAALIFAYEDIFASASWVASPQPADWRTWSPFQSRQVREICAHMTEAERRELSLRGALFGIWNAATFFVPWAITLLCPAAAELGSCTNCAAGGSRVLPALAANHAGILSLDKVGQAARCRPRKPSDVAPPDSGGAAR